MSPVERDSDITSVMGRIFAPALLGPALLLCGVACSSSTNKVYVDAGPEQGAYTVQFPSTAAAVATETVEVYVFDQSGGECFSLVQKRQSHQVLPTPLITSSPVKPCDIENAGAGAVTVPFGKVSVLAVAVRKNADFLIGCTDANVNEASANVIVSLALASTSVSVPTTACTELQAHCASTCE